MATIPYFTTRRQRSHSQLQQVSKIILLTCRGTDISGYFNVRITLLVLGPMATGSSIVYIALLKKGVINPDMSSRYVLQPFYNISNLKIFLKLIPLSSQQQPNTSTTTWPPIQLKQQNLNKREENTRLSILGSECSLSSYYRFPGIPRENNGESDQREDGIRFLIFRSS